MDIFLVAGLFLWAGSVHGTVEIGDMVCDDSDATLIHLRDVLCSSLTQSPTDWCGTSYLDAPHASGDWPSQSVYLNNIIEALKDPSTCLNTSTARDTVFWLNTSQADVSLAPSFAWTYLDFQVQYYDMPRQPGTRIESPGGKDDLHFSDGF